MNKLENNQVHELNMEIEELREQLNRQECISSKETLELSRKLDKLIVVAMRLNGYC